MPHVPRRHTTSLDPIEPRKRQGSAYEGRNESRDLTIVRRQLSGQGAPLSDTTAVGSNPGKDTLLLYSYPTDRSYKRSRKGAVKNAPTKGA